MWPSTVKPRRRFSSPLCRSGARSPRNCARSGILLGSKSPACSSDSSSFVTITLRSWLNSCNCTLRQSPGEPVLEDPTASQPIRSKIRRSVDVISSCIPGDPVGSIMPRKMPAIWISSLRWLAWLPSPLKTPVDIGISPARSPAIGMPAGLKIPPSKNTWSFRGSKSRAVFVKSSVPCPGSSRNISIGWTLITFGPPDGNRKSTSSTTLMKPRACPISCNAVPTKSNKAGSIPSDRSKSHKPGASENCRSASSNSVGS